MNVVFVTCFVAEVLKYVEETNRNAAKLIKSEIHKAKYSTAKQLRNYYVKCFKDSMNDHRSVVMAVWCRVQLKSKSPCYLNKGYK